jgi:hypothetical protein
MTLFITILGVYASTTGGDTTITYRTYIISDIYTLMLRSKVRYSNHGLNIDKSDDIARVLKDWLTR